MSIIAKFKIQSVTKTEGYDSYQKVPSPGYSIAAYPVYTGDEENQKFFQATPGGKLELYTLNAMAGKQFEPGDEVYVTIEKAVKS